MITIVYAHPWTGSFNHAVLERVKQQLETENADYQVVDLNTDRFNPVLTAAELKVYSQGGYKDPLVAKYIHMMQETEKLIVIFPVWWLNMPAILKGFFDKVFLTNQIVGFQGTKPINYTKFSKALLLTTSEFTTKQLTEEFHDVVRQTVSYPISSAGAKSISWHNLGDIIVANQQTRVAYLKSIDDIVASFIK